MKTNKLDPGAFSNDRAEEWNGVYKCEIERANTLERLSRTVGGLQVGITGRAVGGGVILEVEKEGEHVASWCPPNLWVCSSSNWMIILGQIFLAKFFFFPVFSCQHSAHTYTMKKERRPMCIPENVRVSRSSAGILSGILRNAGWSNIAGTLTLYACWTSLVYGRPRGRHFRIKNKWDWTETEQPPCNTLAVHERVDSRFLVLPDSESTITEITEYTYFSPLKPCRKLKCKSE